MKENIDWYEFGCTVANYFFNVPVRNFSMLVNQCEKAKVKKTGYDKGNNANI